MRLLMKISNGKILCPYCKKGVKEINLPGDLKVLYCKKCKIYYPKPNKEETFKAHTIRLNIQQRRRSKFKRIYLEKLQKLKGGEKLTIVDKFNLFSIRYILGVKNE